MRMPIEQVHELLENDPHMLLVDVRSPEEYAEGHIFGAGNLPIGIITDCLYDEALSEAGLDAIAHGRGMEMADDASVIILYSNEGERSDEALAHMESLAYMNVYDMSGLEDWPYWVVTTEEELGIRAADAAIAEEEGKKPGKPLEAWEKPSHDDKDHDHDHCHDEACGCDHAHLTQESDDMREWGQQ